MIKRQNASEKESFLCFFRFCSHDSINKHFPSNSCTFSIFYSSFIHSILTVESSFTHVIDIKIEFRHVHTHTHHTYKTNITYYTWCTRRYWLDPLEIRLNKFREVNALTIRCCVAIAFDTNNIHAMMMGFILAWMCLEFHLILLLMPSLFHKEKKKRKKKADAYSSHGSIIGWHKTPIRLIVRQRQRPSTHNILK